MKKKQQSRFRTHIPEPRWQQVASVIVVVAFLVIELLVILKII